MRPYSLVNVGHKRAGQAFFAQPREDKVWYGYLSNSRRAAWARHSTSGGFVMIGSVIVWLVIGGLAGWLAGLIMQGSGFGLVGNIIVGIVGAAIAGAVLPRLGLVMGGGLIGDIIYAAIGACILLFIVSLVKK